MVKVIHLPHLGPMVPVGLPGETENWESGKRKANPISATHWLFAFEQITWPI